MEVVEVLNQIADSFFSKLREKLVDYVFDTFSDIKNLDSSLETLKNNLKSLSEKALDFDEKMKNGERLGKKKRKREVEEWLTQVKIIENEFCTMESEVQNQGFLKKFLHGDKATQLNAKVHELVEQSQHFGELLVDDFEKRGDVFVATNLSGKGYKENLKRIWNLLNSDKMSSIGIYGMGGVGKTALARHIYNMLREKRKEMRVCWITVSQVFSIKQLQEKIGRFISVNFPNEEEEGLRAARLKTEIGNNFILILDDVWEYICLEKLGYPLRLGGCKLILTTRSFEVCDQMRCQEKVEVKKLPPDTAWDLFKKELELDVAQYPKIQKIAKHMVKVCDGLPLGIIILAGSMRGETNICVWRNELEKLRDPNMVQHDKEDEVFQVLKYSFDRLDMNHQQCFLLCSLYPEDFQISKTELVHRFISEELVNIRKSRQSQLDQGYSILNKLVKVCLLESTAHPYEGDCVKMHDLVRTMALKITKGKNMVISRLDSFDIILNKGEWTKNLEKVSMMYAGIMEIPDGVSPDCPNLTTLLLSGNFELKFISDSFFSQLGNLCVLDLSGTGIRELPNSLFNLENLKVLNLSCDELEDINPNLGKLKKLRELDLSGAGIFDLPKDFFLNFPLLRSLRLPFYMDAPVAEIVRLKHLEEFWGTVENVSDFNKYIRCGLSKVKIFKFADLCYLDFCTDSELEIIYGDYCPDSVSDFTYEDYRNEAHVVQDDLKNEDLGTLVQNIHFLTLEWCEDLSASLLDDFPRMNEPSSLNSLKICNCRGLQSILTVEQFQRASQELESHFFPLQNLEQIQLKRLQNFIGLIPNKGAVVEPPLPQPAIFSSLRSLSIHRCDKMEKLWLPLSEFQNLEDIYIGYCKKIEEIIEVGEGEGRVISFPKLKKLRLRNLPRLKSICNTTMSCGSIEIIELEGCPELKKLPLYFDPISHSPPQTLREILVCREEREWWESLECECPTHKHLLQSLVKLQ